MKAKFGSIVVDGRGKLGGHVYSKNKAGAYVRTKVTPTNPQTADQSTVRNRMTVNSQGWRGLTAAQRDEWNAAVPNFAKTNIFGDNVTPSGFNLYCALNNNLANIGESAINTPPVPTAVAAITSLSAAVVNGTPAVNLTFSPAIQATEKVLLFATPPLSAGKSFVKSEYRQIDVLTNADTSVHDAVTEYTAKFGSVGATGTKIFFKVVPISVATGIAGTSLSCNDIVEVS